MNEKRFDRIKGQALRKWDISFTNKGDAQEWWDFKGRRRCSFCEAFVVEVWIGDMLETSCGQCPLRDDVYLSCCKEWRSISSNYSSVNFLEIINEQARLLYLRIRSLQYDPKWKNVK